MGVFGHFGLGFAVKRFVPQIHLWILLTSTMFADILAMSVFILAPLWTTHGLFMSLIWSGIATLGTALITKYVNSKSEQDNRINVFNASILIGLLVFSHWVIDLIGWSMTGTGIPLLFDDSQLLLLDIQINLIICVLLMELGPMIAGLVIYIHYMKH